MDSAAPPEAAPPRPRTSRPPRPALWSRVPWLDTTWQGRRSLFLLDLAVTAAITGGAALEVVARGGPSSVVTLLLAAPALLLRRRWPLLTVATGLLLSVVMGVLGVFLTAPRTVLVIGLHTTAARHGFTWRTWLAAVPAYLALLVPAFLSDRLDWPSYLITNAVFTLLPLLTGVWVHQRAKVLDLLRERAETAERERDLLAERAVTAERRRIAREMHDVVAHRVSVIALQAGALTVIADGETAEVAEVIRKSGSAALAELRDVLRVLREDESEVVAPGLPGIESLVADAPGRVELARPDPLPEVEPAVGRAAYRVVQEALTNAGKHAPGAPVQVLLEVGERLVVQVRNGVPERPGGAVPGSGYGLLGMRERVTRAGGTVSARPEGGGYVVRAEFPC
ncbi:sensor histidine kinase [Actinosynnema pretiosum]|uniref:histidine kinase n=1 Tax=Actinosynnema pretiosum TaxID=42197 RepID=A0A290Z3H9_9PSEU|nr:histidine kinase [Actinosynnema pretiosum]ATE53590.1 histidine kinase [Actinosynnema pretiosum]